jgi:hypothetical protein
LILLGEGVHFFARGGLEQLRARAVGAAMPRLENLYARLKELTPRRP